MRHGERKKLHNYFNKFFLFLRLKGKKSIVSYLKFIFLSVKCKYFIKNSASRSTFSKIFFWLTLFFKSIKKKICNTKCILIKKKCHNATGKNIDVTTLFRI